MSKLIATIYILCISIGISACSVVGPEKSLFGNNRVTAASANQMLESEFEGFSEAQLISLLSCEGKKQNDLDSAFKSANKCDQAENLRSQVQDRLISASNQRCNIYTTYLKRISTYQNGILGTLTTMLGGAGAIVTGEHTARLLSGLAGISSGTRAELNQAIFESLATSVIIPGIKHTRKELLGNMLAKRSKKITEYTVEGSIADAITYHGACSMDTGIGYAQKSIQGYEDLGIKKFKEFQKILKNEDTS